MHGRWNVAARPPRLGVERMRMHHSEERDQPPGLLVSESLVPPEWMEAATADSPVTGSEFRCPVAGRALVSVHGDDAAAFLHSQLSTSTTSMHVDDVALTSYSDAKGRLIAVMRIIATASGFLLELPADRVEAVVTQLRKYVLRSRVTVDNVSADHAGFGAVGEEAAQVVTDLVPELPPMAGKSVVLENGVRLLPGRGPRASWMLLGTPDALQPAWDAFGSLPAAPAEWWDWIEIESGLPTVHEATAGHFVAQMLNLDRIGALDFRKGCYPGQEVIARMHYLGRVKRRMYPIRAFEAREVPSPGDSVFDAEGDAPCGEIVRACAHPEGGVIALAVLRLESLEAPIRLADGAAAERLDPPYPLDEAA